MDGGIRPGVPSDVSGDEGRRPYHVRQMTRLVLVVGTTETARIPGISAAGANPEVMDRTPSLDAELVATGTPDTSDEIPVSPSGCVTPAVITRAVRDRVGFDLTVVDAGITVPAAVETRSLGASPGGDIRGPEPVPEAAAVLTAARNLGRRLADETDRLMVGESIPGGTTTALGVLRALGVSGSVSSSLPDNPTEQKESVVHEGLSASGLERGTLAGRPVEALRTMGDPVLTVVTGLVAGARDRGIPVTLAGGTQMLTAAALLRELEVRDPLQLATTVFVHRDESVDLDSMADRFRVSLTISDPAFHRSDHPTLAGYEAGEAKEGVAMGGALKLASEAGLSNETLRRDVVSIIRRLLGRRPGKFSESPR